MRIFMLIFCTLLLANIILKFANWAEKNNIKDWIVIQRIYKQAIEVV